MGTDVILNGDVVPVGIEGIRLVIDKANSVTEDIKRGKRRLELLSELVPRVVKCVPLLLGGANGRDIGGLVERRMGRDIIITRSGPASAIEPDETGLGEDGTGVADDPRFLTGQHMPELAQENISIDFDSGRLGGDEQRLRAWTGEGFFPEREAFATDGREIVIDDQPIVIPLVSIKGEMAATADRKTTGKTPVPCPDGVIRLGLG